jgi:GH25 family lysozyme M1 (1,4-beta-N-acetylmuramidase)
MTYHVTAAKWKHFWVLDIEGVGVTQSEGFEDAEAMVRD